MGPLNLAIAGYGGGTLGRNPFDWMEMVRRIPQGSVATFWTSMRAVISLSAMAIVLGQHVRVGNEDNLWGPDKKRRTSVQQVEGAVRICKEFGRKVATAEEAREILRSASGTTASRRPCKNWGCRPIARRAKPASCSGKPTAGKASQRPPDSHPMAYCMVPPAKAAE